MNKVILVGRLTRDVELRYTTTNKAVASFSLAVNRRFQKDTADFINCVAWEKTAEFLGKYTGKGQLIAISGELQSRKYTDNNGVERIIWEVIVSEVTFAQDKPKASGNGNSASNSMPYADEGATGANDNYFTIDGDDDVPF